MLKQRLRSASIKKYMILLIFIFITASLMINVYFFNVIDNISIESDLYQSIKESKDLKADILPPKIYIVESYLIVQQIVNEKDPQKAKLLLDKMEKTREEYLSYYARWVDSVKDQTILHYLVSSNEYVRQFYQIYDEEFIPAAMQQNGAVMQQVVNSQLRPLFEKHREIIDNMSDTLEANSTNIENNARSFAEHSKVILFCVCVLMLLLILFISFVTLKKVTDIETKIVTSQHETEMANKRLLTMVEGLKKFKHNYDNILASINGYVIQEDQAGLKLYLGEIIGEKAKNEMVNYFKLNFIQNPAVTGLIISKMMYAEGLGVNFVLKVRSEVSQIHMKISHLCEILGILLDNAIEAALESPEKQVDLKIEEAEDALVFEIKNSTARSPDQIKMFEKGWTTKGENRGFGLWIAREMIEKYDHVLLNSTITDHAVEQDLLILKSPSSDSSTYFTDVL